MKPVSKEQFTKGTVWKIIERFTGRGISLITSIILTRLLTPDQYGLIAITTVFTNLSDILIDAGFSTALIHKNEIDDDDYMCVFTISIVISVILYFILFFIAPYVSQYYNQEDLTSVLRIMSLVLFVQAFTSTRNAYVNRNMQFKILMKCNTTSAVIAGVIGIFLAYYGYGVWALVFQRLVQQACTTFLLFIHIRWKPRFKFNVKKIKNLMNYSIGVIGASLVNYVENCINSLIIGKRYSVADLGYYEKGNILPEQISLNFFGAMSNVLLPTVSSYQNDVNRLKNIVRKVVSYIAFLIFPIMLGMLMVTKEAIMVLFTERWLPSVPLMQCICIYYIATPLMLIDIQIFFGLGHSKVRLKTEIYRMFFILIGVAGCFIFNLNIQYYAFISAIAACLGTFATHVEVKKLIGYSFRERIKDTYKSIISAILMCFMLKLFNYLLIDYISFVWIKLMVKVLCGILFYILVSILINQKQIKEFISTIKEIMYR